MSSNLVRNLVKNTKNELDRQTIDNAMKSKEVKEAKRISTNIKIITIKELRAQYKKVRESKQATKSMLEALCKSEIQLKREIEKIQKDINRKN